MAVPSPWIVGLAWCVFDIDIGQTLHCLVPSGCVTEEEAAAIAFHAFPDSLSMELHTRNAIKESSFNFRIRRQPASAATDFLYGYVFCRQRQDETLRRGGEQSAVVVLAAAPLGCVLGPLSQAAGHAFFSAADGPQALEQLYTQVLAWPPPLPGSHMSLPAGAALISARLPFFSLLPPPQPQPVPAAKLSLARRASRTLKLRRGASGSSTGQLVQQGSVDAGTGASLVEAAADAAHGAPATAVANGDGPAAGPTTGAAGVLQPLGSLSSQGSWTFAGDAAGQEAANGRAVVQQQQADAAAACVPGSSSSSGSEPCWLVDSLGPDWRDESPFPEVDVAAVLQPLLRDCWALWQLLVTAQPLLVVGLTPTETSAAVAALVSLMAPLACCTDFRPFFTIHDADWAAVARGQLPPQGAAYEEPPPLPDSAGAGTAANSSTGATEPAAAHDNVAAAAAAAAAAAGAAAAAVAPAEAAERQQEQQQEQQRDNQPSPFAAPSRPASRQQQQPYPPPLLIGSTNLYLVKSLPAFPNVVAVSSKEAPAASSSRPGSFSGSGSRHGSASSLVGEQQLQPAGANQPRGDASGLPPQLPQQPAGRTSAGGLIAGGAAAALRAIRRRQQGPAHLLSSFAPHLWCGARRLVKHDAGVVAAVAAALLKETGGGSGGDGSGLQMGAASAPGVASRLLRRHFGELTAALLAPFEHYCTPDAVSGQVPAWRPQLFLDGLAASRLAEPLASRLAGSTAASCRQLYAAFIASPHFAAWFAARRAPIMHLVAPQPPLVPAVQQQPAAAGGGDGDEVVLVQAFVGCELEAAAAGQDDGLLQRRLLAAFAAMPADLQAALASSPARRRLLRNSLCAQRAQAGGADGDPGLGMDVLQQLEQVLLGVQEEHEQGEAAA